MHVAVEPDNHIEQHPTIPDSRHAQEAM